MTAGRSARRLAKWLRRGSGWRRRPDAVAQAAAHLGKPGGRRVVVVTDAAAPHPAHRWAETFATDVVTVLRLDASGGLDDLAANLARLGTQDVIIEAFSGAALASIRADHGTVFTRLFLHLRPGGAYVTDGGALARTSASQKDRHRAAVARFVKESWQYDDVEVVTKRGRHAWVLREDRVADLLPARESSVDVTILASRPAGQFEPRVEEASYGPGRADPWPARVDYPEVTLRHYGGELVSPGGMRLRAATTILPESFRWPHAWRLVNPRYDSVTPEFVRPEKPANLDTLDGDFYFVDCLYSGHFGHLTTEVLCRLWGWERAREEFPDLRMFFHTKPTRRRADGALERQLFTAYGVPESRLASSDRPVRLRSVVGASPMWHNKPPFSVHPDISETWARLTSGLLAGVDPSGHERIFVSRGATLDRRRGCRNQEDVERFFADRGFHVFYPEELSLPEQARLFAGARVVAGFAGSAMFNLMHCRRLEATILISHHAYTARNEHLFVSILGGELHYFWQVADVEPPRRGRSSASDLSSYAFDFGSYGDDLAHLLARL